MAATDELSMYSELALTHRYCDFVCFGALACPALLYTQPFLELFRLAAGDKLVVTIYRDLVRATAYITLMYFYVTHSIHCSRFLFV
jgi:hypothetical protein